MARAITCLAACLALAACNSDGAQGSGSGGADAGGSPSGGGAGSMTPPSSTGIQLVDRLGRAAAACGRMSMFTVPGGWQILAVGDKGCSVWVPPGWILQGSFTPTATGFADASGREGFVGLGGITQAVRACTPAAVTDAVLQGFAAGGYEWPAILWSWEGYEAFGGTSWPTGHSVFTSGIQGTPLVGYLWVLTTQTVYACDLVGLGFWEPQDRIEQDTCTLLQILASVRCPSGGGCDDASCTSWCRSEGRAGGVCNPACECY